MENQVSAPSLVKHMRANAESELHNSQLANLPWIVSAPFDLLFLANLAWPILLLPGFSSSNETVIDFWQVYYLTLPHRWITLFLVSIDRDRRGQQGKWLFSIALFIACVVGGAYFGSGAFLCLGIVDYVWNGWHFASQHAGVLRIYSRKTGGGNAWLERWGMRGFIFYVIVRTAGGLLWTQDLSTSSRAMNSLIDFGILAIPIGLILSNLTDVSRSRLPKLAYLASVMCLYVGYLMASHFEASRWILCLATSASLFHAVEYLAIVSHYAQRREHVGSSGLMKHVASQWMLYFCIFLLSMGSLGWWMSSPSRPYETAWQGLNLWAAFTHYAFDGIIWKLRRPDTAKALGV